MSHSQDQGSTWASVVAAVVVVGTLGVIYLPLVLR
jgi:Tfp pilus assembly major pilin PilA